MKMSFPFWRFSSLHAMIQLLYGECLNRIVCLCNFCFYIYLSTFEPNLHVNCATRDNAPDRILAYLTETSIKLWNWFDSDRSLHKTTFFAVFDEQF